MSERVIRDIKQDGEIVYMTRRQAQTWRKSIKSNIRDTQSEPPCPKCGGLHFGSRRGYCPIQEK